MYIYSWVGYKIKPKNGILDCPSRKKILFFFYHFFRKNIYSFFFYHSIGLLEILAENRPKILDDKGIKINSYGIGRKVWHFIFIYFFLIFLFYF